MALCAAFSSRNTSGRPLTNPTRSARLVYISPVTQNCEARKKSFLASSLQSMTLTLSTFSSPLSLWV